MKLCLNVLIAILFLMGCKKVQAPQGSEAKLIGGSFDEMDLYRFSLAIEVGTGAVEMCTATKIKDDPIKQVSWLITAAHCFFSNKNLVTQPIHYSLSNLNRSGLTKEIPVKGKVVVSPTYVNCIASNVDEDKCTEGSNSDIALIPVDWSAADIKAMPFVNLAESGSVDIEDTFLIVGYGKETVQGGGVKNYLSRRSSLRRNGGYLKGNYILFGGEKVGNGDSGGPLLLITENGYKLAGVTSYAKEGPLNSHVDAFVSVAAFKSFILGTIR